MGSAHVQLARVSLMARPSCPVLPGMQAHQPASAASSSHAATASPSSQPAPHTSKQWQRTYQADLERWYDLERLCPRQHGGAGPSEESKTVAQQKAAAERAALHEKLKKAERQHRVHVRWMEEDSQYLAVAADRRAEKISRLQVEVEKEMQAAARLSIESARRSSTLHKLEDIEVQKKRRRVRTRLSKLLEELKLWLATPGTAFPRQQEMMELNVDACCSMDSATLPWTFAPPLSTQDDLVQQLLRAREEPGIIHREAADMVVL